MKESQRTKKVPLLPPQLKDDGDFANNAYVDISGYGYAEFIFQVGTTDAAIGSTAETAAPKIEECDTYDGAYTDVTDAALADAIAATEDNKLFQIDIDLTNGSHKRFMRVNAPHAGNGTIGANLAVLCILHKPEIGPASAADRGLEEHIIV